jgi:hypothetical protein
MGASDTPYEDRIRWRNTPTGGEGESRLGRYVHTRREDGTFDVQFVSRGRKTAPGCPGLPEMSHDSQR